MTELPENCKESKITTEISEMEVDENIEEIQLPDLVVLCQNLVTEFKKSCSKVIMTINRFLNKVFFTFLFLFLEVQA